MKKIPETAKNRTVRANIQTHLTRAASISNGMRIHFVGISGVSMNALAAAVASRGHAVTGSDANISGHDANAVDGADLVVYTNAIPQDNCELMRARELGIPIIERASYLGELSKTYENVTAVAGCHGKSTTTAMLGAVYRPRRATVHVGVAGGSVTGCDKYFITEACEYRASFLHLNPDMGVILNIQYDHPDFYKTTDALYDAYRKFGNKCKKLVVNGDDAKCRELFGGAVTFGLNENCDYFARDIKSDGGCRSFTLDGKRHASVKLAIAGQHNVYNALATIAAASENGLTLTEILPKLQSFRGIARRFELVGLAHGKTVFTDYAHHPDEIAATIKTAREIYPSVAVVFQPHTYTRTRSLFDEFAAALSQADTVILAPIFSAREKPIQGVTSHALCRKILPLNEKAYCFDTFTEILDCAKSLREKAIIFIFSESS